jgi:hypothetical protein
MMGKSASADCIAGANYPSELKKPIDKKSCLPQQIFNTSKTSLFWKKIPMRTFMSKDEKAASGLKAVKDGATLLLCKCVKIFLGEAPGCQ